MGEYETYEERIVERALEHIKQNDEGYYYLDTTEMTLHLDELMLSILTDFMDKLNGLVFEKQMVESIETTTQEDVEYIERAIERVLKGEVSYDEDDEFIKAILSEEE